MKMGVIFFIFLLVSLSGLILVESKSGCDCYRDGVSGQWDPVIINICPDHGRVRALEFRLHFKPDNCDAVLNIYTQELIDMEIYMNNFYKCPSNGNKFTNCIGTGCSLDLSYQNYQSIVTNTPGNVTLLTSDSFDFFFRNMTMTLNCSGVDEAVYKETFKVVFYKKQAKELSSMSAFVSQTTSHDTHLSNSSKATPASTIQAETSDNTHTEKQATHKRFFDDLVNVTLVSAVCVIGLFGTITFILYCLFRRLCKPNMVLPGTDEDDEETNNDASSGNLGLIQRDYDSFYVS